MALLEWKRINCFPTVCETLNGGWAIRIRIDRGGYKIVNKTTGNTLMMSHPREAYSFVTQKSAKNFLFNHFNFAVTETQ